MKKTARQIVTVIALTMGFVCFDAAIYFGITTRYIDRRDEQMQAKSVEVDRYLPFDEDSQIVKIESDTKLEGELPVVDGAAALLPVYSGFVNAVYPEESVKFSDGEYKQDSAMHYTNTRGAYKALADGDADVIFCAKPSEEQLEYAEEKGVELEMVPIGYEAFVFIVNKDNPVDGLSSEQVRGIYSGEYTKWSEIGGEDRYIDALQRNEGSGSQTAMLSFMGGSEMKRNIFTPNGSAIGFSFRYYVEGLAANGDVKMLALDGVYPSRENIADGSYPVVGEIYAVYDGNDGNENIDKLIEWILSDEGQRIIEESGYVPIARG